MCGVIGIYATSNIKPKLYRRLLDIQHRGQDSYGFSDGTTTEKYLGLIEKEPKNIKGNIALAHTRYRTSGNINLNTSQPMTKEDITLVHNGNVHLDYDISDTYALLDFMLANKKQDIIETIKYIINNVEGSFFVIMLYKNQLYAFKDKHGIRPGCYGMQGDDIIISSENNAFVENNIRLISDINPGHILKIDGGKIKNYYVTSSLEPCIFEYIYLSHKDSIIYGLKVEEFRLRMARTCVELLKDLDFDVVCGIPSSARVYAKEIARLLNKDYFEPQVNKRRSFIIPTQQEREEYVKKKFVFEEKHFQYNNVLLIDDSIVRGTVSKSIINKFKENNCNIVFLSCSPKIVNTNRYGINITSKKELVAHNRSHEEIEAYLGCKIIYQTIDNLYKCSGFDNLELSKFLC